MAGSSRIRWPQLLQLASAVKCWGSQFHSCNLVMEQRFFSAPVDTPGGRSQQHSDNSSFCKLLRSKSWNHMESRLAQTLCNSKEGSAYWYGQQICSLLSNLWGVIKYPLIANITKQLLDFKLHLFQFCMWMINSGVTCIVVQLVWKSYTIPRRLMLLEIRMLLEFFSKKDLYLISSLLGKDVFGNFSEPPLPKH